MKNKSTWVLLVQISLILVAAIATTYAVEYFSKQINVNLKTANIDLTYNGEASISGALVPIPDENAEFNASKVRFSVIEKQAVADVYSGYRVVLNNINIPAQLKDTSVKWELVKGVNVIASGTFAEINDTSRYVLNEELQVLPKYGTTPDKLEFRVWISDNGINQSVLMGYAASMKVNVELYVINDKTNPLFLGIQDQILQKTTGTFNPLTGVTAVLSDGTEVSFTANPTTVDLSTEGDKLITYSAQNTKGQTITKTRIIRVISDNVTPSLDMTNVPESINVGTNYDLEAFMTVTYGSLGGKTVCEYLSGTTVLSSIPKTVGTYTFKCVAYGNNGINNTASKSFTITG